MEIAIITILSVSLIIITLRYLKDFDKFKRESCRLKDLKDECSILQSKLTILLSAIGDHKMGCWNVKINGRAYCLENYSCGNNEYERISSDIKFDESLNEAMELRKTIKK